VCLSDRYVTLYSRNSKAFAFKEEHHIAGLLVLAQDLLDELG